MSLRERQEIQEVLWRISTELALFLGERLGSKNRSWNLQMCSATSRELNFGTLKFSRTSVRSRAGPVVKDGDLKADNSH